MLIKQYEVDRSEELSGLTSFNRVEDFRLTNSYVVGEK